MRYLLILLLLTGCTTQHWEIVDWHPEYRGCRAKVRVHGPIEDRKVLIKCKWKVSILGT